MELTGTIEELTISGNRYGVKINGRKVSQFVNPDTNKPFAERLANLKSGESVNLGLQQSKDGKFWNIVGIDGIPHKEGQEWTTPSPPPQTPDMPSAARAGPPRWKRCRRSTRR